MNRFLNQQQQMQQPNINLHLNPMAQAQQEMQMIQAYQEEMAEFNEYVNTNEEGKVFWAAFQKYRENKRNPTKVEIEKVDSKIETLELTIQQLAAQNATMQQQMMQSNQLIAQFIQNQQEVDLNGNVSTTTKRKSPNGKSE